MNNTAYIYKICNTVNDKVYVGFTAKSIEKRFRWHLRDARAGKKKKLYDAMRNIGYENFYPEILEECSPEEISRLEEYYILEYNSYDVGYNGSRKSRGMYEHSAESKEKMRQTHLGNVLTESHRSAISKALKGRVPSYIPDNKGRKHSDEFKEKCRARTQQTWIVTYPSGVSEKITNLRQFCIENGLHTGCMHEVAHGKNNRTQHKGYKVKKCI